MTLGTSSRAGSTRVLSSMTSFRDVCHPPKHHREPVFFIAWTSQGHVATWQPIGSRSSCGQDQGNQLTALVLIPAVCTGAWQMLGGCWVFGWKSTVGGLGHHLGGDLQGLFFVPAIRANKQGICFCFQTSKGAGWMTHSTKAVGLIGGKKKKPSCGLNFVSTGLWPWLVAHPAFTLCLGS